MLTERVHGQAKVGPVSTAIDAHCSLTLAKRRMPDELFLFPLLLLLLLLLAGRQRRPLREQRPDTGFY